MSKKNKKSLKEFQSALLSNTPFIKQTEDIVTNEQETDNIKIDNDLMFKLNALAKYDNTNISLLINKAITHYLRLKSIQVDEALKNIENK